MMHEVAREMRCIDIKYIVKIEPMCFEWEKFISTLEKHFPDILQEILHCDCQRHDSEQGQAQSIPTVSCVINTDIRCDCTDRQDKQRTPSPRLLQMGTRGQSQHHGSFHHGTLEIPYKCHHNGQH